MKAPFIQDSSFLSKINRVRVSEGRDLENGLRLDRNERVQDWGKQFLVDVFSKSPEYLLSTYPDQTRLYSLISKFHNIDPSNLLLTSGIDGGIKTILEICTNPGDCIGVLSPTYAMYRVYSDIFQINLNEISYNQDLSFNFLAIEKFISTRPKILFIPNPNQPIEDTLSLKLLDQLASICLEANTLIVFDEAYNLFGADTAIPLISKYPNIIIARTFSKAFGVPSIRLGYLISSNANMNILSKSRLAHESNSLSNYIAEYLLCNFNLIEDYVECVINCREKMMNYFHSINIKARAQYGNFVLIDVQTPERASRCVSYLRERKIYVKGPWRTPYEQYITITLGPYESMKKFVTEFSSFLAN